MKTYAKTMTAARRKYLLELVRKSGTMTEAARVAGVNRTHLYAMLREVGWKSKRQRTGRHGRWQEFGL